jgi:methylated-DNA-[protein]-cysteine S-methyltransferase
VTVALTVPTDRRTVLEQVRAVPYGTAVTCAELAGMSAGLDADDEAALELVRRALADNPAPLLIPDHRVRDAPSAPPTDVAQRLRSLEGLS